MVKLTADITITAGLKAQHNVTVDLNGHILRYDEAADPDSIFRVTGGQDPDYDRQPPCGDS